MRIAPQELQSYNTGRMLVDVVATHQWEWLNGSQDPELLAGLITEFARQVHEQLDLDLAEEADDLAEQWRQICHGRGHLATAAAYESVEKHFEGIVGEMIRDLVLTVCNMFGFQIDGDGPDLPVDALVRRVMTEAVKTKKAWNERSAEVARQAPRVLGVRGSGEEDGAAGLENVIEKAMMTALDLMGRPASSRVRPYDTAVRGPFARHSDAVRDRAVRKSPVFLPLIQLTDRVVDHIFDRPPEERLWFTVGFVIGVAAEPKLVIPHEWEDQRLLGPPTKRAQIAADMQAAAQRRGISVDLTGNLVDEDFWPDGCALARLLEAMGELQLTVPPVAVRRAQTPAERAAAISNDLERKFALGVDSGLGETGDAGAGGEGQELPEGTNSPLDPTAYIGARKIIADYPELELSYKELHKVLNDHPEIKRYKPSPQRLQIHVADFRRYVDGLTPHHEDGGDVLTPEELERRKAEIRKKKQ